MRSLAGADCPAPRNGERGSWVSTLAVALRRLPLAATCVAALLVLFAAVGSAQARRPVAVRRLELAMLRLVNADRKKEGLSALKWNAKAADVARTHSRDMAENDFFAHESPTTGKVGDRFFAARIPTAALAENLARNTTVEDAELRLMASPGHRKNILNPQYTELGIGIVRDDDGDLHITQNFLVPIRLVDVARALRVWQNNVNARRRRSGAGLLRWHRGLTALAQQHSRAMAKQEDLVPVPSDQFEQLKVFSTAGSAVLLSTSVRELSKIDKVFDPRFGYVGVAAVRNMSRQKGFGMLWITLIVAAK